MTDTKKIMEELPFWAWAINPLDGRYHKVGEKLIPYFSEYASMERRYRVMVSWLICVVEQVEGALPKEKRQKLENIGKSFSPELYNKIKGHEAITNHDVKSVELTIADTLRVMSDPDTYATSDFDVAIAEKVIADQLADEELEDFLPYVASIHKGLTSEDVNNLAYGLIWQECIRELIIPAERKLINQLAECAEKWANIPMLAHTHGQPATPTTVGKEFAVFVDRLAEVFDELTKIKITGKTNGASGNHSALLAVYPKINWRSTSKKFVEEVIGLKWKRISTQIEPHDYNWRILTNIDHFASIVKKLDVDLWLYTSKEMFSQVPVKGEVGSSTMPHKINPIAAENSEGHIKLLSGMIYGMNHGLMDSRMQRDLSDSAMQRYSGEIFGMALQSIYQTIKILNKIQPNNRVLEQQLDDNWAVLAEAIQTALRSVGDTEAYNELKELTRGRAITKYDIKDFICKNESFMEHPELMGRLLDLTPATYTGYAAEDAMDVAKAWFAGEYFT